VRPFFTIEAGTPPFDGSKLFFVDTATAGKGTFTLKGGNVSGGGGALLQFFGSSSAFNGTFVIEGGAVSDALSGQIGFYDNSSASIGIFTEAATAHFYHLE
jgi:hypothetical protein